MGVRIRQVLRLGWSILYPLFFYLLANEMTVVIWLALRGQVRQEEVLPLTAAGAVLAAVPLGAMYRRDCLTARAAGAAASYGFGDRRRLPARIFALSALAGVGACLSANSLLTLFHLQSVGFDRVQEVLYRPPLPVQVLCTGFLIPVTEELVFRGLAFGRLRRVFPFWGAGLVSAVYFGLFHGNLVQGIYAGALGYLLAWVLEQTGRLRAAWGFHAAANLTAVLLTAGGFQVHSAASLAGMAAAGGLAAALALRKMKGSFRAEPYR